MAQIRLIGTDPSQVPTNGMLGNLAFQNAESVSLEKLVVTGDVGIGTTNPIAKLQVVGSTELSELNLSGISSSISSTAIDVFVYDTRKDSDGGAWRKRTQSTSWYNETLNTATRGARKEFPAVAVIVATTNTITIYDGDDPDMPMWMVFSPNGILDWPTGNHTRQAVSALNGQIVTVSEDGGLIFRYVDDYIEVIYSTLTYPIITSRIIGDRNKATAYLTTGGATRTYVVLTWVMNDVAMTVLPNAPIDPSTSLPVPTIAVATNGGVSIIKDDGSVVDITGQAEPPYRITFNKSNPNEIITSGYWTRVMKIYNIPSSDVSENTQLRYYVDSEAPKLPFGGGALNFESSQTQELSVSVSGGTPANGFYKIAENLQSKLNGMTAYIRTDCNTGWMHGDIKGAWLSDTSTASVTGTELITNGNFSTSDLSAWTTIDGGTAVITGGLLKLTDTSNAFVYASAPFTTVVGKQYVVTFDIVNNGNNTANYNYVRIGNSHNSTALHDTNYGTAYGKYQVTITATATTTYITLINGLSNGLFGYWDNVSARLAEPDRSVNNNGLAVYGTITKTAVATGSNLVGYGGFSASNYLLQPQNTALDFGTGDFSIMFWGIMVPLSGTYIAFQINHVAGNTNLLMDGLGLAITIGGNNKLYQNTSSNNIGWSHQTIVRRSGILYYYSNARLITSNTSTESLVTNSSSTLKIGEGFNRYLALFRISASVPSPSQILKIYNDEKVLFQENSQATLYGASDAVTALAYDDTTDLLSVGTSSGRSDFSGLKRINNTTTAVTTAISASNGLIAEQ